MQFIRQIRNLPPAPPTNKKMDESQGRLSIPVAQPRPPVAIIQSSRKAGSVRSKGNPQDGVHHPKPGSHESPKISSSVDTHDNPQDVDKPGPTSHETPKISPSVGTQSSPQDEANKWEPTSHETPKILSSSGTQGNRREDVHKLGLADPETPKITQSPQYGVHEPNRTNSPATEAGNGTPTASVESCRHHSDLPPHGRFLVGPPQDTSSSSVSTSVNPDLHHDTSQDVIRTKISEGRSSSQPSSVTPSKKEKAPSKHIFRLLPKLLRSNSNPPASRRQMLESVGTLWNSVRNIQSISPEHLSPDDVIIAIMGPTGAGKSFFIGTATGSHDGIGHNLESCTTDISATRVSFLEKKPFSVVFVDTPGFDDTNKSDGEILDMIAQWLKRSYERNIKLSGILYLHRISDNRMAGTPLKNLRMFQKLCGENALRRIILTTTMWSDVYEGEGDGREEELRTIYWKTMIEQGSTVARFSGTPESAWSVVECLFLDANDRCAVEIQREMVDLKKKLPETKAGQELYGTLDKLVRMQRETLRRIKDERERTGDEQVLSQLNSEYDGLRKNIETTIADMQVLKLPLGKRLIRMLFSLSTTGFGK